MQDKLPPSIEQQKIDLESRRLAIDESWPKRWGGVLIPATATLIVTIFSATVSYVTTESNRVNARVESDRAALEMYFANVHAADDCRVRAQKIGFIEAVTLAPGLKASFISAADCAAQNTAAAASETIAVAEGLPDYVAPELANELKGFTAYIQYPPGRQEEATALQESLGTMGLRVPGIEQVSVAPDKNQVRFYSTENRDKFSAALTNIDGLQFEPRVLGGNLPNGVVEFWLGKTAS